MNAPCPCAPRSAIRRRAATWLLLAAVVTFPAPVASNASIEAAVTEPAAAPETPPSGSGERAPTASGAVTSDGAAGTADDAPLPTRELLLEIREARIAVATGRIEEGIEALLALVEAHPRQPLPMWTLLDPQVQRHVPEDRKQAVWSRIFEALTEADLPIPRRVARIVLDDRELPEERLEGFADLLAQRAERRPDDVQALELLVDVDRKLERWDTLYDRLRVLRDLVERPEIDRTLAHVAERLERWPEAAAAMQRWVDSGQALVFDEQRLLGYRVQLGEAEAVFEQIDRLFAKKTAGWRARGAAADSTGAPAGVDLSDVFNLALQDQYYGTMLEAFAWDLWDAGKSEDARRFFEKALELAPGRPSVEKALLYLFGTEVDIAKAEAAEAGRRAKIENPEAMIVEAVNLLSTGDAPAAYPLLQRATEAVPSNELAWYNLGLAAHELERWEVAAEAFGRAAAINPERVESTLSRGVALYHLGRCDEAVPLLDALLRRSPETRNAHFYLYRCHQAAGDRERAARHLEAYKAGGG